MKEDSEDSIDDTESSEKTITDELAILEREFEIARERLDTQKQTLRDFAKEGQKLLRITLVFVGLLLTAVSVAPDRALQTLASSQPVVNFSTGPLTNLHVTIVIAVGLTLSALTNLIGNEERGIRTPGETEDFEELFNEPNRSENEYLRDRISDYQSRIQQNDTIISVFESILAMGKLFFTVSIVGMSILSLSLVIGPIPSEVIGFIVVITILLLLFQVKRFPDEYIRRDAPNSIISRLLTSGNNKGEDEKN